MLELERAEIKGETDVISFFNRDHIISVTIRNSEIVIVTTAGTKITVPASPALIAKFADELTNDIQSNFVSITSTPRQTATAI